MSSDERKGRNDAAFRKSRSRELRRNLTAAEARLWTYLKGSSLDGRKFRRQHSLGPFFVDFFCSEERLAVELDGQAHDGPIAALRDEERTAFLREMGIRVVRFENRAVFSQPDWVLTEIRNAFRRGSE